MEIASAQAIFLNLATDFDGTEEIDGNTWNLIPAVDPPVGGAANFSEVFIDEIFDTEGNLVPDVGVSAIGGYNQWTGQAETKVSAYLSCWKVEFI